MSILTGWTALDCYLTSKEQFSAMIMVRTSCNWWDDDGVCFVPDSHTCKDNYRTSSMKQQSTGTPCHTTWTHYPDSETTSLFPNSLMMCAKRRNNTYQFDSLWFHPTGTRTHYHTFNLEPYSWYIYSSWHWSCHIFIYLFY